LSPLCIRCAAAACGNGCWKCTKSIWQRSSCTAVS
jgi:hypothetical protein